MYLLYLQQQEWGAVLLLKRKEKNNKIIARYDDVKLPKYRRFVRNSIEIKTWMNIYWSFILVWGFLDLMRLSDMESWNVNIDKSDKLMMKVDDIVETLKQASRCRTIHLPRRICIVRVPALFPTKKRIELKMELLLWLNFEVTKNYWMIDNCRQMN